MGLFGKSDVSTQSDSLWNRLTKNRKQDQKSNCNDLPPNRLITRSQIRQPTKPSLQTKLLDDSKRDSFRLSLQSLRAKPANSFNQSPYQQHRISCPGTEQPDFRLRTSKLQCEQLKKKVATISLECNKLENQCRELKDVKENLLSFQSDISMLKRKEKVTSEIQQRLNMLEEDNSMMRDQIEKLRIKVTDLDNELDVDLINKRLEQLEAGSHQLTSITIQNRRDHDSFSLDVGNQLVETFITQQTIYEEFRRLQHRLVSVERQNQIMADLIHFHCHNSTRSITSRPLTNSDSSRGPLSMQASMEAASSSLSPPSSDREAEKINTSPSNIDWLLTDQSDSLFLCDTLNKSSEPSGETLNFEIKTKDYYKIDFTAYSESLTTLPMTDLSVGSMGSEEISDKNHSKRILLEEICDGRTNSFLSKGLLSMPIDKCSCFKYDIDSASQQTNCQKDDGYYSTSHDGTMNVIYTKLAICDATFKPLLVFLDKKERYFILTKHLQKSHCRSKRTLTILSKNVSFIVNYSVDLESQLQSRKLRQKQHKQRESHLIEIEDDPQVFSDTELYGTRFCIDSDLEDDEQPSLFISNKVVPIKRPFSNTYTTKSLKSDSRHISSLPPLIEHVSERERKIEIKSSKQSRIVPPRTRPKTSVPCSPNPQKSVDLKKSKDKPIIKKCDTNTKPLNPVPASSPNSKDVNIRKPPKGISSPKSTKPKLLETVKVQSSNHKVQRLPIASNDIQNPPPIPPRPKKKTELFTHCIYERDLASLDYVNEAQLRTSPEAVRGEFKIGSKGLGRNYSNIDCERKMQSNFSSPIDEYYIEDDDVDDRTSRHISEFDDFFDQDFISELENYQLPNSSVNVLVLQHFK